MGEDPIGSVFALLILIFGISILPMILIQNNVDAQSRSAAEALVQDFADNARSTGYITKEGYDKFKSDLVATGYSYHVEMLHRSKIVVPNGKDASGNYLYTTAYNAYNFNDILDIMEVSGRYSMKDGDFFQIKLTTTGDTKGSTYLSGILGGSGQKMTIPAGGLVGNTN